jgi:hypothetical protein
MYRWEVVRAYEDGQEIVVAMTDNFCTAKDSQGAVEKLHEKTFNASEFIVINDREFIMFHQQGPKWNVVYVVRRVG